MDWLMSPINSILEFIQVDVYGLIIEAYSYLIQMITLGSIKFTIWSVGFGWDIATQIIEDLGVTDALNQAWSTLDGDTISVLSFFAIPDVISILLTAFVTSYTMKFIPFVGK